MLKRFAKNNHVVFFQRNHNHHGTIPTLSQQISHDARHTRKKKRRSKHLSSSAEYPTGLSHTLPLSPGNSIRTPVNGHLPTLGKLQLSSGMRLLKASVDVLNSPAPPPLLFEICYKCSELDLSLYSFTMVYEVILFWLWDSAKSILEAALIYIPFYNQILHHFTK